MTTSRTVNRKRKKPKPLSKKAKKRAALLAFLKISKVAKARAQARINKKAGIKPTSEALGEYKARSSRRGNALRSYAPELSRGLPGSEESDP